MNNKSYTRGKVDTSIYITDKHKQSLEELNLQVEKMKKGKVNEITNKLTVTTLEANTIENGIGELGREALLAEHTKIQLDENDSWLDTFTPLNNISIEQLAIALYVGYEVELTAEEELIAVYKKNFELNTHTSNGVVAGILFTLGRLGIEIEGINK